MGQNFAIVGFLTPSIDTSVQSMTKTRSNVFDPTIMYSPERTFLFQSAARD